MKRAPKRVHVKNDPGCYCLDKIILGDKKYEGRLASKVSEWDLKIGDYIDFYCDSKEVRCVITELLYFNNFGEAYDKLGDKLMPSMDRKSVVKMYNSFWLAEGELCSDTYPCINVSKHNVVCIGINVERVF